MTTVNYPHGVLPSALVTSASHVEDKRIIQTTINDGYRNARKRFTQIPVNFNFQLILDESSLSYFQAWFANELDYGLNWFNMNMPVGEGLESSHVLRFLQNPTYTWNNNLCTVNAKCEGTELN
jgi:hypothetical protein